MRLYSVYPLQAYRRHIIIIIIIMIIMIMTMIMIMIMIMIINHDRNTLEFCLLLS